MAVKKAATEKFEFKPTTLQLDALKELGNMGAGNAATSLSQMLDRKIVLTTPNIDIVPLADIPALVGGPEELVSGVFLHLFGEIPGSVILIFKREDGMALIDMMLGRKDGTTKTLTDQDLSAFLETGNILSGAYLTALGNFFETKFTPSVPNIILNLAGVLVDFVIMGSKEKVTHAIVIGTEFQVEGKKVRGEFILLLGVKSLQKLMKKLEGKVS